MQGEITHPYNAVNISRYDNNKLEMRLEKIQKDYARSVCISHLKNHVINLFVPDKICI